MEFSATLKTTPSPKTAKYLMNNRLPFYTKRQRASDVMTLFLSERWCRAVIQLQWANSISVPCQSFHVTQVFIQFLLESTQNLSFTQLNHSRPIKAFKEQQTGKEYLLKRTRGGRWSFFPCILKNRFTLSWSLCRWTFHKRSYHCPGGSPGPVLLF